MHDKIFFPQRSESLQIRHKTISVSTWKSEIAPRLPPKNNNNNKVIDFLLCGEHENDLKYNSSRAIKNFKWRLLYFVTNQRKSTWSVDEFWVSSINLDSVRLDPSHKKKWYVPLAPAVRMAKGALLDQLFTTNERMHRTWHWGRQSEPRQSRVLKQPTHREKMTPNIVSSVRVQGVFHRFSVFGVWYFKQHPYNAYNVGN